MDSKEALGFINRLFWENEKPILNELEESIFLGIWKGNSYADITAKTITANTPYSEPHVRDTGAKLCKRIKEDLGINLSKRNFKNPIEYRYNQQASEQASPSQSDTNTTRLTSPPTPLLPGEGSKDSPLPLQGRGAGGVRSDPKSIEPHPNSAPDENAITNPFVYNDFVFEQGSPREPVFTVEDVEAVISDPEFFKRGRYYFDGVWGQAARGAFGQQAILKVLAPHPEGLSIDELRTQFNEILRAHVGAPLPEETLHEALTTLTRHDVIKESEGCWQIIVELFRRWVLQP